MTDYFNGKISFNMNMKETRGAATGTKDTKSATIISQKLASVANAQAPQSQPPAPADKPKASKPKKD